MISVILIKYDEEWIIWKEVMLMKRQERQLFTFIDLINRSITSLASLVNSVIF